MTEKALFGIHGNPMIAAALARCVRGTFEVEYVLNIEQMLAHCRQTEYGLYVMDLNLGAEGSLDITPAQTVYQLLQEQKVEGLEQKFIGVSGAFDVIELAQQEGLPAVLKTEFVGYFSRLFPRK